jgi:peptide/nickel transport system permease protein/peptide/nickel transport system substrate-binding protein
MFDTLVEFEYATLKAKPGLAEAWRYTDPKTLVLDLRRGVVFHDGTPFDAAAAKFNLDRNREDVRSNVKSDLNTVEAVEITGPHQVTLRLKQPDTALPLILSDRAGMMVSPKAAQELGKEHDRRPVGTGAWKFVSWADNEKITVTRNENYWKPGLPYLDGIEFSIIPEVNTGLRSVVAGQNDFVYFLSPQQKPVIDRSKNLVAVTGPTLYCVQIYFNYGRPPLNDVRVRQAINYAIDRESFSKATMAGLSEPAMVTLPASHWAHDKAMANFYAYDPEKARRLLAEAGHKDGLDLHLLGYSDQRSQQRQEVLIEQFRKAGIRARFSTGSIPEMTSQFFVEKKGDGYLSAWTGRPDPSLTYQLLFGKDSYYNAGRVEATPDLTAALLATRTSEDLETRRQAFAKLQRIVTENALVVPLVFQFEMDAHVKAVKGYEPNLLGKPKFERVYLEG